MSLTWAAICVAIALLAFVVVTFNGLVVARNRVRTAWADIDVQLQRRYDLVPQLAAAVTGYAEHERSTLAAISALRVRAQQGASIAQRGELESGLTMQITRLLALQESYPALKASENFLQLQRDLVAIEDRLQDARRAYNDCVREYNTQIEQFPDVLLSRPFGFRAMDFFQAENTDRVAATTA
jgi:LemA protein